MNKYKITSVNIFSRKDRKNIVEIVINDEFVMVTNFLRSYIPKSDNYNYDWKKQDYAHENLCARCIIQHIKIYSPKDAIDWIKNNGGTNE